MTELYAWNTPNGQKPAIMLEELGVEYSIVPINLGNDEQHSEKFHSLNPNNKIPVLITSDGITIFESGAILQFLADSHGQLISIDGQLRADQIAWCYWQAASLGPMIGQWGHFAMRKSDDDYPKERFLTEVKRLFDILEETLTDKTYLCGDEYSIADIMCWPWVTGGIMYLQKLAAGDMPAIVSIERWQAAVAKRPAVNIALEKLRAATS